MRKPAFCICENKDADQLRGNREADQRLCFRYMDSTIPLLSNTKSQDSSHLLWLYSPVCVGPGRKPRRPVFSQRGSFITDRSKAVVLLCFSVAWLKRQSFFIYFIYTLYQEGYIFSSIASLPYDPLDI